MKLRNRLSASGVAVAALLLASAAGAAATTGPASAGHKTPSGLSGHASTSSEKTTTKMKGTCWTAERKNGSKVVICKDGKSATIGAPKSNPCPQCRPGGGTPAELTSVAVPASINVIITTPQLTVVKQKHPEPDTLRLSTSVTTNDEPVYFHMVVKLMKWPATGDKAKVYNGCHVLVKGDKPKPCEWTLGKHQLPLPGDKKSWHFNAVCSSGRYYSVWHEKAISNLGVPETLTTYFPSDPNYPANTHAPDRKHSHLVKAVKGCPWKVW
jgi:hypothetical protein